MEACSHAFTRRLVGRNKRSEVPAMPFCRRLRYRNVAAQAKPGQSAVLQIVASPDPRLTELWHLGYGPLHFVAFRLLSRPMSARPT